MSITEVPPTTQRAPIPSSPLDRRIPVTRKRIDQVLIGLGAVITAVLLVAGGLLYWGNDFAEDYVTDELSAQNISFPPEEALVEGGRQDLVGFAGLEVTTGEHAEAYASFIAGHIDDIADGMTYAQLGGPERVARSAVNEAIANDAPASEIATLEAEADALTNQRDTIFRGEMLRGALLSAFAWSTIGRIAGLASVAAFTGAALMALLVAAGMFRIRKATRV